VARQGSTSSAKLVGREEPRLLTPPLRRLTRATSRGFELADFSEQILGVPLLPWQKWLAVHALELDRSGGYRFRTVVVLVGRQNGKTHFMRALALWRLYVDQARLVLSVAQSLDIAREAWRAGCEDVMAIPDLVREHDRTARTNGDEYLALSGGRRWKIGAANRAAGRGLSVDLLLMDELREQRSWDAWSALSSTTLARPHGQTWGISNAGDDESVVLNHLRDAALAGDDPTLALFEWSAPDGCDLDDPLAWAQACPGLGHTVSEQAIRSKLATDPPPVFRTEVLCQRVDSLADVAVPSDAWASCHDAAATLEALRDRVSVAVDVAPHLGHATLCAAATGADGRVRVEAVAAWDNTRAMVAGLPLLLERIRPKSRGYFRGPTDAVKADLGRMGFEQITDVTAACQGLAEQVAGRRVLHAGDPLLTSHVTGAKRLQVADGWRFTRRGMGDVDAAYAAAGAVHLARLMPARRPIARKIQMAV
jgi:hypothetical protein